MQPDETQNICVVKQQYHGVPVRYLGEYIMRNRHYREVLYHIEHIYTFRL
jgi:hypothetical protein